ncbi:MAG TPA: hypothetical protein VGO59_00485 [Verrucomicrobiae bacterium]
MTKCRREEIHYYDASSFLLSGIMEVVETEFGKALKQTTFGDYREFAGFLMPTRIGWQSPVGNGTIKYHSIEVNTVEESALKMPAQSVAKLDGSGQAIWR